MYVNMLEQNIPFFCWFFYNAECNFDMKLYLNGRGSLKWGKVGNFGVFCGGKLRSFGFGGRLSCLKLFSYCKPFRESLESDKIIYSIMLCLVWVRILSVFSSAVMLDSIFLLLH